MLKKFGIPVILCVIVILTGCDEGIPKMMKPVLTPEPTTVEQPMSEPEVQETVYPEITYENALDLQIGETYRMHPSSYEAWDNGFGDNTIRSIHFGSVGRSGQIHKGVSPDDPKMSSAFFLRKEPYSQTLDGKNVIDWIEQDDGTRRYDEILIQITDRLTLPQKGEKIGGPRGDRFTYMFANYGAVVLENLTHPDRKLEYE